MVATDTDTMHTFAFLSYILHLLQIKIIVPRIIITLNFTFKTFYCFACVTYLYSRLVSTVVLLSCKLMTVQNVQVHTRKATKDSSFRLSLVRHMLRCCVVVSSFFYVTISWVYSEVIHPRHYEGNIVVGVIAAKEVTYIEEWLAHHFYYGVDKIVVFDDNKPEDILEKAEMKRICESFGDRCEIMDFNQYDNVACLFTSSYLCSSSFLPSISGNGTSFGALAPTRRQGMAMKELYYHDDNYQKYRWVMMFDVDEFMVTKDENTTIPQVLSMLPPEVHAVHVPRLNFGTSNHDTRPEGSVRNNYCWAEKNIKNSKGMARPNEIMLPGKKEGRQILKNENNYYVTLITLFCFLFS